MQSRRWDQVCSTCMPMPHGSPRGRFLAAAASVVLLPALFVSAVPATADQVPAGRTVYVTNSATHSGTANIIRFTVNRDGALVPLDRVRAGHGARGMAITPDRRFAYVAAADGNEIDGYRIGRDGSLSQFLTVSTPRPSGLVTSRDGRTLYVVNQVTATITVFAVQSDGALVQRAVVSTGGIAPKDLAVTPDGRFIYVGDTKRPVLTGFAVGSDGIPTRPVARAGIGLFSGEVLVTRDGRFLYVVCTDTDDIFGFRIEGDGTLTEVSHLPAGERAEGAAISPDGRLLYVAGSALEDNSGPITGFTIGADGVLTPAGRPVLLHQPPTVAFAPDGKHLYATDFAENTITTFAVSSTGDLTTVKTQPSGGVEPGFQAVTLLRNR
ncbi:beta-propeller fold lactonase family protein [Actinoplanes sp. NPDC051513]|uniref:beta-propeller fold lactonase family protein n=1 Tax=Actinoplanes sp. NPDC051513 TaxID=3363908 RepID=UPI00379650EF